MLYRIWAKSTLGFLDEFECSAPIIYAVAAAWRFQHYVLKLRHTLIIATTTYTLMRQWQQLVTVSLLGRRRR